MYCKSILHLQGYQLEEVMCLWIRKPIIVAFIEFLWVGHNFCTHLTQIYRWYWYTLKTLCNNVALFSKVSFHLFTEIYQHFT